ncbi:MAG: hypothetical protein Q8P63_00815 [Candidatus Nealsonbacteria bacterium]|nr:hypothetical protein [Candidatus Nealsonbacteria bacterium]
MNQAFSKIWILIILTIFIAGGLFTWQYFGVFQGEEKPKDLNAECSPITFSDYEVAKNNKGEPLEFYLDLNGDNKEETVRVYREAKGECERVKPTTVKVFSGTDDCQEEVFSYQGEGNEAWGAQVIPNFLGDGSDVVMVKDASYSCGCGGTTRLIFFAYQEGRYSIIEGPQFGGLGGLYMFDGDNGLGKRIIVTEERWTSDPSDYCCGCVSRRQFIIYNWNGEEYVKTIAGITQNKYLEESIDEILQKEPSVLNSQ